MRLWFCCQQKVWWTTLHWIASRTVICKYSKVKRFHFNLFGSVPGYDIEFVFFFLNHDLNLIMLASKLNATFPLHEKLQISPFFQIPSIHIFFKSKFARIDKNTFFYCFVILCQAQRHFSITVKMRLVRLAFEYTQYSDTFAADVELRKLFTIRSKV